MQRQVFKQHKNTHHPFMMYNLFLVTSISSIAILIDLIGWRHPVMFQGHATWVSRKLNRKSNTNAAQPTNQFSSKFAFINSVKKDLFQRIGLKLTVNEGTCVWRQHLSANNSCPSLRPQSACFLSRSDDLLELSLTANKGNLGHLGTSHIPTPEVTALRAETALSGFRQGGCDECEQEADLWSRRNAKLWNRIGHVWWQNDRI